MARSGNDARLRFAKDEIRGVHVLTVSGDVDLLVRADFRAGLVEAVDGANSPLVIDLSGVNYIDAGGFTALIEAQQSMTARPDNLYVVVKNPLIRRLFRILELDDFFDLYSDAKAAMAAAEKGFAHVPTTRAPLKGLPTATRR